VVEAGFALSSIAPFGVGGRWITQQYGALRQGGFDLRSALMLDALLPTHPILSGVASFHGGNAIAHNLVQPQGCAELVATWTNGRPLVAAGAGRNGGRVVALNFYPVSDNFSEQYWQTATNGEELLANSVSYAASAHPHAAGPAVALVAADESARVSDVRCKLHNLETFSRVDVIDAQTSTPDIAALSTYAAVLTWTGSAYGDPDALGTVLAEYVDSYGGVVHSPGSLSDGPTLAGRWSANDYNPLIEINAASDTSLHLQPFGSVHPLLTGVRDVDGGEGSHHATALVNTIPGEPVTVVANWTNGQPMVAFKKKATGGYVASLNMFPPSSDALGTSWNRLTDGARLMANMLLFVGNHAPTADAGGNLRIEATSAVASVTLTAATFDADNDPLTMNWSVTPVATLTIADDSMTFTAAAPTSGMPSLTYTVTLTVTDGKGGQATDVVEVVVEDTTGPVLQGLPPGPVTLEATGPDGAPYTPTVTAVDAVDGTVAVNCSPSGVFPVGDTVVSCTSSDSRGHQSTASITVTVTDSGGEDPVTPGKVFGYGYIRDDDMHYEFAFMAVENAAGFDRGGLILTVKSGYCGRHRHSRRHNERFVSKTVDSVAFTNNSSVLFAGTGKWNGRDGYRYDVSTTENTASRRDDIVRITITSPGGATVATIEGKLSGGNVQFVRWRR
jgi:hypothetical protein